MPQSEKQQAFDLSQFKQKITPEGKEPLEYYAYRMDGDNDNNIPHIAKNIDLYEPACCDYLYINDHCKEAILIEDTNLVKKLKREITTAKQSTTQNNIKTDLIQKLIRKENCIKVYGSCIILDRLKQKYTQINDTLVDKNLFFWFVINDGINSDIRAYDNIISSLKDSFRNSLAQTKLVKKTRVLILNQLKAELKKREHNKKHQHYEY